MDAVFAGLLDIEDWVSLLGEVQISWCQSWCHSKAQTFCFHQMACLISLGTMKRPACQRRPAASKRPATTSQWEGRERDIVERKIHVCNDCNAALWFRNIPV